MGGAGGRGGELTGGTAPAVALACWRSALRRTWRQGVLLSLVGGLLGAVALGALAGARSTDGAYGRYLSSTSANDVYANLPGRLPGQPLMRPFKLVAALPGVAAHSAFAGLNAYPVVHGHPDNSFLTAGLVGSIDGEFFSRDRIVPVAGTLPAPDSASSIVLTAQIARLFGVGVGGTVTYEFPSSSASCQAEPRFRSYRVAAIGQTPPVLVDQADQTIAAVLPPGATRPLLACSYGYGVVGLRLTRGPAGIPDLQARLATLAADLQQQVNQVTGQHDTGLTFWVERNDRIHDQVQQSITPEAVALAVFGLIAAVAMVVLVAQGLTQLVGRLAPDLGTLRSLGAGRGQVLLTACLPGLLPVAGITALAGAGAVALSPLSPVGPVRGYDPDRGVHADALVLGIGLPVIVALVLVLVLLTAVTAVSTRPAGWSGRRPARIRATLAGGLPPTMAIGLRNAVVPGTGRRSVPVLSTLGGSVVAVTAMAAAIVFSASLSSLGSHPARYGWNWDVLIQAQGGYSGFTPGALTRLVGGQAVVAGWSELAFTQLPVDGRVIPVMGIQPQLGDVAPPTTSGQPLSGPGQVELGATTLAELGKNIGDTVTVGRAPYARQLTISGVVTLPSLGAAQTEHVSLGRGVLLRQDTLLAAAGGPQSAEVSQTVVTSTAVIALKPGTTAAQHAALVNRIIAASPDGVPGETYELRPQLAAEVLNAEQIGWQPVALAAGLAAASLLSLSVIVLSLVRRRRREFGLLKALGMTRRQVRAVVAWQSTLTLLAAGAAGVPLGIVLGRVAWQGFARSLGVVPVGEVPLALLLAGLAGLVAAGNLLAALPATVAARTRSSIILRSE